MKCISKFIIKAYINSVKNLRKLFIVITFKNGWKKFTILLIKISDYNLMKYIKNYKN